eukprot:GSMAST32.ASY1.ANO1.424.1 assembled CDS
MVYDVCIIGAGPAGLSVLSAIHNPEGVVSESSWRRDKIGNARRLSVCVIDPGGTWLSEWKGRFKSLNIDMLRSPAWASPDFFSTAALLEYALKNDRMNELHSDQLPKENLKDLRQLEDAGLFQLPGKQLFEDFCDDLAASLPHTFICGKAQRIEKQDSGVYEVFSELSSSIQARRIVFALGAASNPQIPQPLAHIHHKMCLGKTHCPRIIHTFQWSQLQGLQCANESVVVVGGGLSSAQAALLAVERGASRVIHVSRRPLESRHYDLPLVWLDPRAGWRASCKGRCNKFRMYEFFETPKEERARWVKKARGGASIPQRYIDMLDKEVNAGRMEHWVDDLSYAECCDNCETLPSDVGHVHLKFRYGSDSILADRVILATGSKLDLEQIPLLKQVVNQFQLPIIDGLPDIDEDLDWGDEFFSVVGALALLQIGPDNGNLSGCRRCAERCANNFYDLTLDSGFVYNGSEDNSTNFYSSLLGSSSSDSETDESESD